MQEKDVEIFALPPPRTPGSSRKNARPNKNVLTTPNQNQSNGTRNTVVTPKGKNNPLTYSNNAGQIMLFLSI